MPTLDFQIGDIVNVDNANNVVYIRSFDSGGNFPLPLSDPIFLQTMPKPGSLVLLCRYGMNITKIVKIWEIESLFIRQGNGNMLPGEVQVQSKGGSYVYLNNSGDVSIVDGGMRNVFKMIKKTFQVIIQASEILFQTFGGLQVSHKKDGSFQISKNDPTTKALIAQISIDVNGNIVITGKNISLINGRFDIMDTVVSLSGNKSVVVTDLPPGTLITDVSQLQASDNVRGG